MLANRRAADAGNAGVQFQLGLYFAKERQFPEALKYFRLAADQTNAAARFNVGLIYALGLGVPEDHVKAARWFRLSADQGDAAAQLNLGVLYANGQGVTNDLTEAAKWFRKSALQGNTEAQFNLGLSYIDGLGVTNDLAEAAKWFRKAAENGHSIAQVRLGIAFQGGNSVPQDYVEAAKWFHKAAEQGNDSAELYLAIAYRDGEGVPTDDAEAGKWFRKAAEHGNRIAQAEQGGRYERGDGVPQDYVEAYKWFNVASTADGSSSSFARDRDRLANKMTREQIAEGQRRTAEFLARKETAKQAALSPDADLPAKASGSGFFITEDGYLLTCQHVIEDADAIRVVHGGKTYAAKLVKADKLNDVAVLKVSASVQPLPIASSRAARLGDAVFTIGFPNTAIQGTAAKLTRGEINSLSGMQDDARFFQISAAVQPGNSGGPLVDQHGNVVGIATMRLDDLKTWKLTGSLPQNVNYAVKSSVVNVLLESLPEVAAKVKDAHSAKERKSEDVVKEAQGAVVLVLVY